MMPDAGAALDSVSWSPTLRPAPKSAAKAVSNFAKSRGLKLPNIEKWTLIDNCNEVSTDLRIFWPQSASGLSVKVAEKAHPL